jgi:hypothetical protein
MLARIYGSYVESRLHAYACTRATLEFYKLCTGLGKCLQVQANAHT